MGGHPYWYFVPYQAKLQRALDELRDREFKAGRYNPVIPFLEFSDAELSKQIPGPKHKTIAAAIEASAEDGTRSILDIAEVGSHSDYGVAGPLPAERLVELYETDKPTRNDVEPNMGFLEDIERGKCVYVILYDHGKPSEICFAGYSYD